MPLAQPADRLPNREEALLEVKGLSTHFVMPGKIGKAVENVSFSVAAGETLGVVGESGSGKSIMALSLLQLLPRPFARIVEGEVRFKNIDLMSLDARQMRQVRGRGISMVLQDPMTALNPVLRIGDQIAEAINAHLDLPKAEVRRRVIEVLELLHVPDAARRLRSYPHEFSGGMRQRVVGAIALVSQPELLIADEPTTALDVTVQDQYLNLLKRVQSERKLAIIFITHDLAVVARICDRVAVMYAGNIVELATTDELFEAPRHPYTRALLRSSLPEAADLDRPLPVIEGSPPSIFEPRHGCAFAPRCPMAVARCRGEVPPQTEVGEGHLVRCWETA